MPNQTKECQKLIEKEVYPATPEQVSLKLKVHRAKPKQYI
jgi:hypothetical protein